MGYRNKGSSLSSLFLLPPCVLVVLLLLTFTSFFNKTSHLVYFPPIHLASFVSASDCYLGRPNICFARLNFSLACLETFCTNFSEFLFLMFLFFAQLKRSCFSLFFYTVVLSSTFLTRHIQQSMASLCADFDILHL